MPYTLTDRQKELFQEDKHTLVDTIIILENKLLKAVEKIGFLNNEMLLTTETLKAELETERQARVAAEGAHIISQQELDGDVEPIKMTEEESLSFDDKVLRAIGKYEKSRAKEGK